MSPAPRRIAGVVLLCTAGCTQLLGLHDRSEATDSGAPALPPPFDGKADGNTTVAGQCGQLQHPSGSCASCMDNSCCAEARACAGEPACQEASDCLAACADPSCRARCAEFYSSPDTLMALRSCRVSHCAAECGSTCGEFASPTASCQSCKEASCCSQGVACASNTSCLALSRCVSNCFTATSCPTDCQSQNMLGMSDYQTWFGCTNQCDSACPSGQNWTCLANPSVWPKPSAVGTITFSVTFVTFTSEEPFLGETVKACGKLDYTCSSPIATTIADSSGIVTFTVPTGLSGFDGYLDVSGGKVAGTGAPVFPSIWYPVPFVVADGWRGRTQIPSTDEVALITAATGTTADPTRAQIAVNAVDCDFGPAADVSFSVDAADPSTIAYYLVGGVPVTTATKTDQSGIGAFLNVPSMAPARLAVVTAVSGAAGGREMGSLSFILRPGTLTTSSAFPPLP